MNLTELCQATYAENQAKGFAPLSEETIHRALLLVISEITEAQNELRTGRGLTEVYYSAAEDVLIPKPEGFPVEITDAIIRLFDICGGLGLDLDALVEEKRAFNRSRAPKHGKRF